jgi:hypothetical protein
VDADGLFWGADGRKEGAHEAADDDAGDSKITKDIAIAFGALASRTSNAYAVAFIASHKKRKTLEANLYMEAAKPAFNRITVLSREEEAKFLTPTQAVAAGRVRLCGAVADVLAAAAARLAPAELAVVEPKVKPLTLKQRMAAHVAALPAASKRRWKIRVFTQLRPKHDAGWRLQAQDAEEHLEDLCGQAWDDTLTLTVLGPDVSEEENALILAAHQDAQDGCFLVKRFPLFVAAILYGKGTLVHPAVKARQNKAANNRRLVRRLKWLNAAQRAAEQAENVRTLPDYLKAVAPEAYMQPLEVIKSLSFKNLPLAESLPAQAELRQALSQLVERLGGAVAKTRGALFIPTAGRGGPTKGFGFVECVSSASAQRVLEAGPTVELEFQGITSVLSVELAASNRKSKEEMEAAKVKAAAERDAGRAKVLALMKAEVGPKSTKLELADAPDASDATAVMLAPVCLGSIAAERKAAAAVAEAAALKEKVAAMFATSLGTGPAPKARKFKLSFGAAAAKPAAPKVEVVDAFTAKVGGMLIKVEAAAHTELGRAQELMRRMMAKSEAEAKQSARDIMRSEWEKAKKEAEGTGWDVEDWVEPE